MKPGDLIDGRYVTGLANYKGDHTHTFLMGKPYGPNTLGEYLWPLALRYDKPRDTTIVAFTLMDPS